VGERMGLLCFQKIAKKESYCRGKHLEEKGIGI
jgi:hypothetical protein